MWMAVRLKYWCQLRCVHNSTFSPVCSIKLENLKSSLEPTFSHFPKVILNTGTQQIQTRRYKYKYIIYSLCDRRVKDHYSTLAKGILIAEAFKITLKGALILS